MLKSKNIDAGRVIVTGAAGWIGQAVCRYLLSKGKYVVALDREGSEGVWSEFVQVDISSDSGLILDSGNLGKIEALIHCAGYAHRPMETPEEVTRFFSINRDGTRRVVDLCETLKIPRIVYLSSIAFYDWASMDGRSASEDDQLSAPSAYARSKLDGEAIVRESSLDWRVLRLATVFGNGDRANFSKLASALKYRRFIIPGVGDARKSVIALDRVAECICRFAEMENPIHRLLNLGYSYSPTLLEICDAYSEQCGFDRPKLIPLHRYEVQTEFPSYLIKCEEIDEYDLC
jgi:nucleoside-diphosphate-sugar epimerase